nr:RecName: Full=Endochitinase 3 [Taxus baccata]
MYDESTGYSSALK